MIIRFVEDKTKTMLLPGFVGTVGHVGHHYRKSSQTFTQTIPCKHKQDESNAAVAPPSSLRSIAKSTVHAHSWIRYLGCAMAIVPTRQGQRHPTLHFFHDLVDMYFIHTHILLRAITFGSTISALTSSFFIVVFRIL